jgi:hypothetical protein
MRFAYVSEPGEEPREWGMTFSPISPHSAVTPCPAGWVVFWYVGGWGSREGMHHSGRHHSGRT